MYFVFQVHVSTCIYILNASILCALPRNKARSGEKFEPISTNPYLSILNRLFNEINRLFLEFLLEIENFIENRLDINLKFFISTGYFQISTGYLITKPRFSPDIGIR
jgi:hypothetical protein